MTELPSPRRRLIGAALRRYRENLGWPLEDAARVLECDRSKISRIETGQRGIRPKELRELLTEYGVPEPEQAALAGLASRGGQHGWWDDYAGIWPGEFTDYLMMESAAAEVLIYQADLVPDLLQTQDYTRAIAAARPDGVPVSQLTAAMAARQRAILDGSRQVAVVLGEAALRQEVGGPEVMAAQLTHLSELAGGSAHLMLQVLPFTAGAHPAAGSASHAIVRFPQAPSLGVVYPQPLSGLCLTSQADIRHLGTFAQLRSSALSAGDTTLLLRTAADGFGPPW